MNARAGTALATLAFTLFLAGCFGVPDHLEIVGTVKMIDPITTFDSLLTPLSLSDRSGPQPSHPFRSSPGSSGVSSFPAPKAYEPTYEYMLTLARGASLAELRTGTAALGFAYQSEAGEGYHVVLDTRRRPPEEAIRLLSSLAQVAWVEENGRLQLLEGFGSVNTLDAHRWALRHVRAVEAWAVAGQGDGIVVAVVDTGVDFTHPALADPSMWVDGWDFTQGDDGVAYGYRAGARGAGVHGTMVAGIIAARDTGDPQAPVGVAPKVKLMPIKIFDSEGKSKENLLSKAIRFAVDRGVQVINLSLGLESGKECNAAVKSALHYAWAAGVVVVAASGNQARDEVLCPARHPTVIAVGATNAHGERAYYSNAGPNLDLVAPGGEGNTCLTAVLAPIPVASGSLSCPSGEHRVGTSFAAPHVSGAVALMLGRGAATHPDAVKQLLHMTARDLGAPGRDDETGYGLLDAYLAASTAVPTLFAAQRGGGHLRVIGSPAQPGEGGHFRLAVPGGAWTLVGWADVDHDNQISPGDYFGAVDVAGEGGRSLLGVELTMTPYYGEPLTVQWSAGD